MLQGSCFRLCGCVVGGVAQDLQAPARRQAPAGSCEVRGGSSTLLVAAACCVPGLPWGLAPSACSGTRGFAATAAAHERLGCNAELGIAAR